MKERVLAATVVVAGLAACSGRGPVEVVQVTLLPDGRTLDVAVASCNGDPAVDVTESAEAVTLSVVASGSMDDCQDVVTVGLDEPLGDRDVVDRRDGEPVGVRR